MKAARSMDWIPSSSPPSALARGRRREKFDMFIVRIEAHPVLVDHEPPVLPANDQVGVDGHGEVAVVDLQDLEVVESDADVERRALLGVQRDRRDESATIKGEKVLLLALQRGWGRFIQCGRKQTGWCWPCQPRTT